MAVRRSLGVGTWSGGFGDLADYIAGIAKMYGENALLKDRQRTEQENVLQRWRAEQAPELLKYMSAHPESADDIAHLSKQLGLDLDFARPSDSQLTAPLAGKISGATKPIDVPDVNQIITSLNSLHRPSLTTPGYGVGDFNAPSLEGEPSTPPMNVQGHAPTPVPDSAVGMAPLPSTKFGPVQSPAIAQLEALANNQRTKIAAQEQHDLSLEGQKAETISQGSAQGQLNVHGTPAYQTAVRGEAQARTLGENSPEVGAAKVANEKLMTPVLAQRAGAEENARQVAEYAVKYDPANVAKEVDLAAKKAAATLDAGVLKQRAKNIETAKMNAVPLAAQLKTLSALYARAVAGDLSAVMAYHDMAQNLRPTIARATGYSGRITNAEMNIAGNMIPSIVLDNLSGNALLKFKTLEGLARYGPEVAASVTPDAPVESYLNEVSRVVNQNMSRESSPIISPDVPKGNLGPKVNVKPSPALDRLRSQ